MKELATSNRNADGKHGTGLPRKGDDIADRLLDLAAGVVKVLPMLARRPGAKSLVKQLERCAPAGGANYEEARGAESPADFIHKVRIALPPPIRRAGERSAARADCTFAFAFLLLVASSLKKTGDFSGDEWLSKPKNL